MKKLVIGAIALGLLALGSISLPVARAQVQVLLPVPDGMCTADQLAVAYDRNNLYCKTVVVEASVFVAPIAVSANTCDATVVPVTGALTTDRVVVNAPSASTHIVTSARPGSTDGSIIIDACNVNTSTRTPVSGTYKITLLRNP